MRADSILISLSMLVFVAAMLLEGVLFLPIISASIKAQVETITAYVFGAGLSMLAVVGITSLFKRKF